MRKVDRTRVSAGQDAALALNASTQVGLFRIMEEHSHHHNEQEGTQRTALTDAEMLGMPLRPMARILDDKLPLRINSLYHLNEGIWYA